MRAIKCDRCEKYYDPYRPKEDVFESNMLIFAEDDLTASYYEHRQFELCSDCMRDAVKFMREKLPPVKE